MRHMSRISQFTNFPSLYILPTYLHIQPTAFPCACKSGATKPLPDIDDFGDSEKDDSNEDSQSSEESQSEEDSESAEDNTVGFLEFFNY